MGFQQGDNSNTRQYGGLGLGLPLAKALVELMGGELSAERLNIGSRLSFTLKMHLVMASSSRCNIRASISRSSSLSSNLTRLACQHEIATISSLVSNKNPSPAPVSPCISSTKPRLPWQQCDRTNHSHSVLIVDDVNLNRTLAQRQVQSLGYSCMLCENGMQAVEELEMNWYPVVLMDCHMPVMDGWEATREIRKMETERGIRRTFICALTAEKLSSTDQRCRNSGMDECIYKPFGKEILSELLHRVIGDVGATDVEEI
eukprot:NODE_2582_length_899_cov_79.787059_g2121_i0.p1 GENE.NODE_2582_length_899_cov_79.787059_g2121_i0~~NODE_2582_length_899_cov_79.787059_g2121_i0.p1  ORF type:complete len:259 (-),score=44.73 NODE_2582_length_899_cov_79.787059_g2121_i0:95-871(-)